MRRRPGAAFISLAGRRPFAHASTMNRDPRTLASYLLSASMALLGIGLIYFAFVLTKVVLQLPVLIDEIQVVQENLEPVVAEVAAVATVVENLTAEVALVREPIPPILGEVEAIRLQVPPILEETAKIREVLPDILAETAAYRGQIPPILAESAAYREQIPVILAQVDEIQAELPGILTQIEEVRVTIEGVIAQVEGVRAEVPAILDRVENISMELQEAGQKAGEGAVKGVFTGIIKTPFSMLSGVGGVFADNKNLTDEDRSLFMEVATRLMESGSEGDEAEWRNDNTRLRGQVVLVALEGTAANPCCRLHVSARKGSKDLGAGDVTFCRDSSGNWTMQGAK